jgi:hypothetical protein
MAAQTGDYLVPRAFEFEHDAHLPHEYPDDVDDHPPVEAPSANDLDEPRPRKPKRTYHLDKSPLAFKRGGKAAAAHRTRRKQQDVKVAAHRQRAKDGAATAGVKSTTMPSAYVEYMRSAKVIETSVDPDRLPVQFRAYAALNEDDKETEGREEEYSLEDLTGRMGFGLCKWNG